MGEAPGKEKESRAHPNGVAPVEGLWWLRQWCSGVPRRSGSSPRAPGNKRGCGEGLPLKRDRGWAELTEEAFPRDSGEVARSSRQ
jgi:hypothetical protein